MNTTPICHHCPREADFSYLFLGETRFCCTTHQISVRHELQALGYNAAFDPDPFTILSKAPPAEETWKQRASGYAQDAQALREQLETVGERLHYLEAELRLKDSTILDLEVQLRAAQSENNTRTYLGD